MWEGGAKRFPKIREAVSMRVALTSLRSSYPSAKHLPRCAALQTRREAAVFPRREQSLCWLGVLITADSTRNAHASTTLPLVNCDSRGSHLLGRLLQLEA